MRRTMWLGAGVLVLAVGMPSAWAARLRVHEQAESSVYSEKAVGMLGRGLLNLATGFVDVCVRTIEESKTGTPVVGTVKGLLLGTGCGLLRTGSGVVDLLTFWVPGFTGAPVSASYNDCLETL